MSVEHFDFESNRRRGRFEIFLDVMQVIASGIYKPTRIMYASNLSWEGLRDVLDKLLEGDLVEELTSGRRRIYRLTDLGRETLAHLLAVKGRLGKES